METHMLAGGGDWLVKEHITYIASEFCVEGFLNVLKRG